jgi:predicted metal-dependent phosphoesterase TrpH
MVVADLHVHTTNSDGELPIEDLSVAAREASLEAVAVTDHDRPHPALDEPVSSSDGVTIVHGIELRVDASERHAADGYDASQRVDLLGYGLDPTPALREEVDRIQRDRVERGRRIVANVEEHLGVTLDVEPRPGFGRPHIARAIVAHPDLEYDLRQVFEDLIGEGRPCYVARDVPTFEAGRTLLGDACSLVGLAHPLRYGAPDAALALTADLDAIELSYPYDRPVDPADQPGLDRVRAAIERNELLATGGSDAHGRTLGATGLSRSEWERVEAALR